MKSLAGIIAIVLAAVVTLLLLPAPVDGNRGLTAITDVRLFDGERVIEDATLLIADGRVSRAGSDVAIPEDARVIDGAGRTVLPGLIDAHVHAYGNARTDALRMGVTTLLDMFRSPADQSLVIEQRESLRPTEQADLFSAGFLATAEGGHGTQYGLPVPIPESPETADEWVAQRLEEGSDYIKIIVEDGSDWGQPLPTLEREMVTALVSAAHARGVLAVAHVSTQASARMAVEAGIDGLVHLFADEPVDDAFIDQALEAGIFIVPTTPVLAAVHGQPVPDWLTEGEHVEDRVSKQQRSMLSRSFPGSKMRSARWPLVFESIRKLHDAGVPLLAGSDAGNPGTAHGPSLHHELALMVEAGLTPLEALKSATSIPAERFGLEGRGCLQSGCRADVLLVDGNPFRDIRHTLNIERIWKNGHEVDLKAPETSRATGAAADPIDGPQDLLADHDRWMSATDRFMGGQSESRLEWSDNGLALSGRLQDGFAFPYAGGMWSSGEIPMQAHDLSGYQALTIEVDGPADHYQVLFFSGDSPETAPAMLEIEPGQSRRIEFAEVPGFDPGTARAIGVFHVQPKGEFAFNIEVAELQ